jgi:hypothetical protein
VTYLIQNEIANSRAMLDRVAQAAASENVSGDPDRWTYDNRRDWAAAPGWDAAWESYKVGNPPVEGQPYDPGLDEGVITDGMILSQVQAMTAPPGGP